MVVLNLLAQQRSGNYRSQPIGFTLLRPIKSLSSDCSYLSLSQLLCSVAEYKYEFSQEGWNNINSFPYLENGFQE